MRSHPLHPQLLRHWINKFLLMWSRISICHAFDTNTHSFHCPGRLIFVGNPYALPFHEKNPMQALFFFTCFFTENHQQNDKFTRSYQNSISCGNVQSNGNSASHTWCTNDSVDTSRVHHLWFMDKVLKTRDKNYDIAAARPCSFRFAQLYKHTRIKNLKTWFF